MYKGSIIFHINRTFGKVEFEFMLFKTFWSASKLNSTFKQNF